MVISNVGCWLWNDMVNARMKRFNFFAVRYDDESAMS